MEILRKLHNICSFKGEIKNLLIKNKKQFIEDILLFVFAIRPIIDLAWKYIILLNMNLAGLTAIIIIILSILYFTFYPKLSLSFTSCIGIIYVIYIGTITLINSSSLIDFNYSLRLMSEIVFLIVIAPHISIKKLDTLLLLFTITTLVPIFITYFQTMGIIPYTYFDYINGVQICRGSGGYRQPSVLTRFCSIGLLYTFYMLEDKKMSKSKKSLLIIYIILNILAIILSYHRTGYLLVIIETLYWLYLKNQKKLEYLLVKHS